MVDAKPKHDYKPPPSRRLRVYAFDPQVSTKVETAGFNVAIVELPWERDELDECLSEGPTNNYFEVIDIDPISQQMYDPVDLNDPYLLAQDGLMPSEGDPRFHQQMTFAIAMRMVLLFERALGRIVFWAPRRVDAGGTHSWEAVPRLRIYPHALREPNAYYSFEKKALLFGYFKAQSWDSGARWVFTALSHDIIAHETTHAILDGLHRRYAEATSVDSLAFHEAFADIVALMSHFMLPEAVRYEIADKGGSLDARSLMSGLALQFGKAMGMRGALREAFDKDPNPEALAGLNEPHDRGAVLVEAIFEAFLTIYRRRTADLFRIAGVRLEPNIKSQLHPDLVERLTREACKAADHILRICIRALDYLPPVDVRFGEFLRAIVTADYDLVPLDPIGYRLAFIDAFRKRGIFPTECLSLAVDSLLWERPAKALDMKDLEGLSLEPTFNRDDARQLAEDNRKAVERWFQPSDRDDSTWQDVCGVIFPPLDRKKGTKYGPRTILEWPEDSDDDDVPKHNAALVRVHSVRATRRAGPDGQEIRQLIIEVVQKRRGFLDPNRQAHEDDPGTATVSAPDFVFRGGATLIFDLNDRKLRYTIRKRVNSKERLAEQRKFLSLDNRFGIVAAIYGGDSKIKEPFAMLHRGS